MSSEAATCGACGRPLMSEDDRRHLVHCSYPHCTVGGGTCWGEESWSCKRYSTSQKAVDLADQVRSLAAVDPDRAIAMFSPRGSLGDVFKQAWRDLLLEAARILEGEVHGHDLAISIASFEGEEWPNIERPGQRSAVELRTVLTIDCREGRGLSAEEVVTRYGQALAAAGIDRVRVLELDDEMDIPRPPQPSPLGPAVTAGGSS